MFRRSLIAKSSRAISAELRDADLVDGARRTATPILAALPVVAGLASVVIGMAVLLGWAFGIAQVKSVLSGLETMKPVTALAFVLSGALLWLRARDDRHPNLQKALSVTVLAIGLLTLIQFGAHANFWIGDVLIKNGWVEDATRSMSVPSATEFVLFSIAMLLSRSGRWSDIAFVSLTMLGLLVALLVFAGYLYNIPILYEPIPASSIALHTAVTAFVLFIGAALTRPHTGWVTLLSPNSVTGSFAPWLLPSIVFLPIGLGWVLNQFILSSAMSSEFGVDLFALSSVFFLVVVVWRTGTIANRLGRNIELREQLESRLREARAAAEEAAAAKSEFLANMTHELRTPLNSIVGFAGLLAKSSKLSAANRRFAKIIDGSSKSLLALVNDILDFSSLEAGAVTLHPVAFSLPKLAEDIVASVSLMADEKGLKIKIEKGNTVGEAHFGDVMRLHQVMLNLVNNAIKFTSKGEVTIALSAAEHSDSVQHLRIEVRDTGIGISPERLQGIFGRFAQADTSIHGRFGGTGLGLAISKRLIELMGGTIGADSAEGEGTTIWIELTLPCADPKALLDEEFFEEPAAGTVGRRILVVDDVDLNRDLVAALLGPHGHVIDQAEGGAEAVEAVKSGQYDLVLMDIQMPGMNGLDATRTIRAMNGFETIPIIAMTAQALQSQWEACREAGMSDHLPKPITPAALFVMLDKWLGESEFEPSGTNSKDREIPAKLREEFLAHCARDLARVKLLLASNVPGAQEELRKLAHRVAGTAAMVGLPDLSDDAVALKDAIAHGAEDELACDEFLARLGQLVEAA